MVAANTAAALRPPPPTPDIQLSAEVAAALRANTPVVALESTIIAHGMPYPDNLRTAESLESAVRLHGATPATVAVIHGLPHVGLSAKHLRLLASPESPVRKLARRDLPLAYARKDHGATTVSATMAISHAAGVRVFATGGVGGVHRGVNETWDVSADIAALASIPQLVVCAGAKSLLDLPKTLEALESASVPVLVLRHAKFPAFYTRGTLPAPAQVSSEDEAARVFYAAAQARSGTGVLLAVPVPVEFEADAALVEHATTTALQQLANHDPPISPQQVTPFLLRRVADLTGGASLTANMHLARNNAAVAARVAVALSTLNPVSPPTLPRFPTITPPSDILVFGGVCVDILCTPPPKPPLQLHVSNRGAITQTVGGVAKNIAHAATQHGSARVLLVSAVGADPAGDAVRRYLRAHTLDDRALLTIPHRRTATCCVVHDERGDLAVAVGDFDDIFRLPLFSTPSPPLIALLSHARFVVLDGNLPPSDLSTLITLCHSRAIPTWFEPTTPQKALRLLAANTLPLVSYLSPNESELHALSAALPQSPGKHASARDHAEHVLRVGGGGPRGQRVVVTRGEKGAAWFYLAAGTVREERVPGEGVTVRGSTTGAGDCLAGVCVAALVEGQTEGAAIAQGVRAAERRCRGEEAAVEGRARL